jgi:hypothetical protein
MLARLGDLLMGLKGRCDDLTFNLPRITLIQDEKATLCKRAGKQIVEMDLLERKVVVNSGMLIGKGDSVQQPVRTVATCLADAVGLCVDFNCLMQMS